MKDWVLKLIGGFGRDDLLIVIGAVFIFRGLWYWDPALSYISVGILALFMGAVATGLLRRRR